MDGDCDLEFCEKLKNEEEVNKKRGCVRDKVKVKVCFSIRQFSSTDVKTR